ncbi:putative glycine dehydrogenase subunit 1 [Weizmannia acidilactici]|uniref:Probable glycine dehydrogenase (decarboxylating) subunit 1 n=1 Tax=Weizmannia acidilactici TaxID=2607726 RepID=A0A5J4JI99_9BACI|nr:aminomethyl-transferring glycine dehydrogenase subunit GcvPA [Weizmannia acidilactici]GER68372.1 putative glycine dehydrogenase subunit 1 [Weizmannia acidilactici]GER71451.1 putative glycine dehydrogenase subunit 1 [Weizmannia acidilactici]GER72787.1 putative glycine dehydrogenase subunit 1 [Weizmannia acidilactici]
MMHRYLPMTEEDRREMLDVIGVDSVDELFADIPEKVRFKGDYRIKKAKSETALLKELAALADKNANLKQYTSFLGAGVYDHYIPAVVDHVISRSEFYTAYTPYQPEISQGELQAIFEFQTMICELTGMEVANSSMYDGGTAMAEAAMLASGQTRRKKILVSKAVHPQYRAVLHTYAKGQGITVEEIPLKDGRTDIDAAKKSIDGDTATVIVQYPNFFGSIELLKEIEELAHAEKAMFIVSANLLALGIFAPPGDFGADITVGDCQVFGIPASFGGPHCGYFAATSKLMRKIPGRLVGETVDENGKRGYVLTLQAREQHIRRDKATSNICSNQALNALAASVAIAALGKKGVKEMALANISKAQYAKKKLEEKGFEVAFGTPFFNEFLLKMPKSVKAANDHLLKKKIIGGYDTGRDYPEFAGHMLIAVTEMRTKAEIDQFAEELGVFCHGE